jgi:putative tricarboxylic transport membrane protein
MQPVYRTKNIASGALLVAIGSFFAYSGRGLEVSSVSNMGPGYFPLVLSALLIVLGIVVMAGSGRSIEEGPGQSAGPVPWRGIALLTGALLFFACLVRPLGLGPALGGAVAISCFASQRWRLVPSLVLTASMVACGWAVFIRLLGIPIPFLGPWFH